MMKIIAALLKRELLLAFRHQSELLNPILFFIIVVSLFPLAITPDPKELANLAPGIIWVAALLANLLALELLFKQDCDDGVLTQLFLSPCPSGIIIYVKVFAQWLMVGLPLVLISPLLGMMLSLPWGEIKILMLSLVIGTPSLTLIGAIIAGLTVSLKNRGVILSLILLPLYIPILIFGSGMVIVAKSHLPISAYVTFMLSILVLALTLAPLAALSSLKVGMK